MFSLTKQHCMIISNYHNNKDNLLSAGTKHLYLIPSMLGESALTGSIPDYNLEVIRKLKYFVVENIRSARRFLIKCGIVTPIDEIQFYELNEHTNFKVIAEILSSSGNNNIGLISEAGLPAIADPGAELIREAHLRNLTVIPLVGPSSVFLALMASGLNGQQFAFNGYLPVKENERNLKIRFFEKRSRSENQTQIFIEAPYRNNRLFNAFIEQCSQETLLCIASNITLDNEWISTKSIQEWKNMPLPDLKNKPAVFILKA